MNIPTRTDEVPHLDTDQMIEVDRLMTEEYHIDLIQMMENAGRCLAILARERFLGGTAEGKRVAVMAGSGGNGGGALVAARRLHSWGAHVTVLLAQPPDRMTSVPRHQLASLVRMGVACVDVTAPAGNPDLILDGLVGYNIRGAPYGRTRELIVWANAADAPTLALDTPSGIDTATGTVFDPAIVGDATMTLALPKKALSLAVARPFVGELYLADIGVPPSLYSEPSLGLDVGPLFATHDILRLPFD